jgi:hypothetical protein
LTGLTITGGRLNIGKAIVTASGLPISGGIGKGDMDSGDSMNPVTPGAVVGLVTESPPVATESPADPVVHSSRPWFAGKALPEIKSETAIWKDDLELTIFG